VRFGDPETQAVLPRLRSDAYELLTAAARPGGLAGAALEFGDDWAVTLVLASAGYPATPTTGDVISGLDDVAPQIEVTHAGTARRDDGAIVTAGGRVLNVTALGPSPASARDAAYAAAQQIDFAGRQLRGDIALRAVERTSE
jgi:phosphoribosylamine--glycine ligase